jgi:hypothetical protein
MSDHPVVRAARFAVGHPLDGTHRTNAGWTKPGTAPYDPDRAGWWAHQSHRRRSAIRWGALLGITAAIIGILLAPGATASTLRIPVWFGIVTAVYVVVHKTRRWEHYKRWIEAIALAVGPLLDMPRRRNPREWIHVPIGHQDDPDKPVLLTLPENFAMNETRRERLALLTAAVAGVQNPFWQFDLEARPPTLLVSAIPQPPTLVVFSEIVREWENAADDELIIGLAAGGVPARVSLGGDSPHILCSMGSGGGKSEFCAGIALQMRRKARPARVIYIDVIKRGASAKWAKGVDGIEVIRSTALAHDLLLELFAQVQARCESYWDHGYDAEQQRVLIIVDEANRTTRELTRYWRAECEGKGTSPAVDAIEGILFVGREAATHVLTVGQRMSAAASGGGDAREAYGVKIGNRFSPQTARMLFGDVGDGRASTLPRSSNHPGRVQVVTGGSAVAVQVPLSTDRATKALLPGPAAWIADAPPLVVQSVRPAMSPNTARVGDSPVHDVGRRHLEPVPNAPADAEPPPMLIALPDAVEQLDGVSLTALKNARARDKDFPEPAQKVGQTYLYDLDELARWAANRAQAGAR